MKKGTQSTIQSSKRFSPLRPERRLEKASSLKATESIIIGGSEGDKMLRREKVNMLNKSIEEQLKKAKLICEAARIKNGDCKTSREDNETAPSILANFRERGRIIENHQIFSKLRMQSLTPATSPAKPSSPAKPNPKPVLSTPKPAQPPMPTITVSTARVAEQQQRSPVVIQPPRLRISSLVASGDQPLQRLQEVREIESFVLEDQEEDAQDVSIVEGHGAAVLDWGLCMGRASEFRVLKFLDEGKYGKVYLAQNHRNNAIYSIKSIYWRQLDEKSLLQLQREVKIQLFLSHPHVVRLYHFFVDEDSAYLILQPCLGRNLYQNLKDVGKVQERIVKEWVRQVCGAVQYMHRHDIIHRDLKPENILLHQNMIKICDFGWAIHSPLLRETHCGTPLYTSPELVEGRKYDSKIDIWSIGILTYELLYGTIPFEIRHNNDMVKIIEQEVYFSQDVVVSQAAKDFMMSCLHKDPNQRATIRQLLDHEFLARLDKYRWTII